MSSTDTPAVDRELLSNGLVWLVRGIAIISVSLPLTAAEEPWSYAAPAFGPLGALAVAIGVWRVVAATPATTWGPTLRGLAVIGVPLRIATEIGVSTGNVGLATVEESASVTGPATATLSPGPWDAIALVTIATTFLGVIALARHLDISLAGVAADRWRQVTLAWVATLVIIPVSLLTAALELFLVAGSVAIIAAVLLVLTILATYRAAEDDQLDAEFPKR